MSRDEIPEGGESPSRSRTVIAAVTALGCLAVLAVAGWRLTGELTREPTAAERADATAREVAARYRTWSAGRIFPARLRYTLDTGSAETATRVGIDPGAGCAAAVDPKFDMTLTARGCRAVLRATYLDQLQGLVVTVGVAAFPDEEAARDAARWFPADRPGPGLRALAFPGSMAARFGDAARQTAAVRQRGPYVVAATVGYSDGRPAIRERQRQRDLTALGPQLADGVLRPLASPARITCGTSEWTC